MNYKLEDAQQCELKSCNHYYSYSLFEVSRDLCRVKDSDKVYLNIVDIIEHEHEEEPFDQVVDDGTCYGISICDGFL